MRLKLWLTLSLLSLSSCGHTGPKIAVCVSNPSNDGFECYDERTQKSYHLNYSDSDKYVALSPTDAQTLFNFCGSK